VLASFWKDFSGMPEALEKVSGIIKDSVFSHNPIINEGLANLFNGGGKMLRPGLFLIAARFGKTQEKHYKLAAALEMLHMATLAHDDVIDDSPLRRGHPTLQLQYGKRNAVLIGDFLLSRCFLLTAEYTSPENAVNLARIISVICNMEIEQNNDRFKTNISMRNYLRKIIGKSASLFSLACFAGAYEAKVNKELQERFRRIGYNIGVAFQIIDDILDYTGDPQLMRKSLGSDIKEGLITMPLLCALEMDSTLCDIFSRETFSIEDSEVIFSLVRNSGGTEEAAKRAGKYTNRALREIASLPAGENRNILETITKRLLLRQE